MELAYRVRRRSVMATLCFMEAETRSISGQRIIEGASNLLNSVLYCQQVSVMLVDVSHRI